jgi:hypothetical protein
MIREFMDRHNEYDRFSPEQEMERARVLANFRETYRIVQEREFMNIVFRFLSIRTLNDSISFQEDMKVFKDFLSEVSSLFQRALRKEEPTFAQILNNMDLTPLIQESPFERIQEQLDLLEATMKQNGKQDLHTIADLLKKQQKRRKERNMLYGDLLKPIKRLDFHCARNLTIKPTQRNTPITTTSIEAHPAYAVNSASSVNMNMR